jgi:hypothetical protein
VLVQRQRGESNFASQDELGLHAHTAGPSEGRRRSWRRGAGAGHAGVCARHVRGVFHRDPHRRPCRGGRKRVFRGCDGNAGEAVVVGTTGAWSEPRRAVCLYKYSARCKCASSRRSSSTLLECTLAALSQSLRAPSLLACCQGRTGAAATTARARPLQLQHQHRPVVLPHRAAGPFARAR